MIDAIDQFKNAMRGTGLEPPEGIEPGKWCRFSTNGKRGDNAGFCKLFPDLTGGVYGDYRRQIQHIWQAKRDQPFNQAEREAFKRHREQARLEHEAHEKCKHADAAERAAAILRNATGDPRLHPYALKKSVNLGPNIKRGIWEQDGWDDALLVPIYGANGKVWSIEAISRDGKKRYLAGGKKHGGFYPFGEIRTAERILIGEGVATVAAAVQPTACSAIAAMDAGNLEHAARAVREVAPNAELIFLADMDIGKDGRNTGVQAARAAARTLGGRIAIPELDGRKCDFWDIWHERGAECVANAVANATSPNIRINVGDQELPRITKLAWDALIAANDPPQVFRHGSLAARIENDDQGYPTIRELTLYRTRHRLARVASWYATKGKNEVEVHTKPPLDVVRDVLATPDLPLPVLDHIVEAPIFAADGTLQTMPGYHLRTKSFYAPAAGFTVHTVSKQPSA